MEIIQAKYLWMCLIPIGQIFCLGATDQKFNTSAANHNGTIGKHKSTRSLGLIAKALGKIALNAIKSNKRRNPGPPRFSGYKKGRLGTGYRNRPRNILIKQKIRVINPNKRRGPPDLTRNLNRRKKPPKNKGGKSQISSRRGPPDLTRNLNRRKKPQKNQGEKVDFRNGRLQKSGRAPIHPKDVFFRRADKNARAKGESPRLADNRLGPANNNKFKASRRPNSGNTHLADNIDLGSVNRPPHTGDPGGTDYGRTPDDFGPDENFEDDRPDSGRVPDGDFKSNDYKSEEDLDTPDRPDSGRTPDDFEPEVHIEDDRPDSGRTPDDFTAEEDSKGPERPDSGRTPDDTGKPKYDYYVDNPDKEGGEIDETGGLDVMNAIQVMAQAIKDQNTILQEQTQSVSKLNDDVHKIRKDSQNDRDQLTTRIDSLEQSLTNKLDNILDELKNCRDDEDVPHSGKRHVTVCQDGSHCTRIKNAPKCCWKHGGRKACPSNSPFMCIGGCGKLKSRCCVKVRSDCIEKYGGVMTTCHPSFGHHDESMDHR